MNENKILFTKIKKDAIIPTKERHNAGYDIYCCFEDSFIIINPQETKLIPSGIASVIPEDFYIQICERGSSGSLGIKSSAGVIDSSYRGEWFMAVTNINNKPVMIVKNEYLKNAEWVQSSNCIIYPYEKALFQGIVHRVHNELLVEEIPYTELGNYKSVRGNGKLGSSGK